MTEHTSSPVTLVLAERRLVPEQETLRRRTVAWANGVLSFFARLVGQLFPSRRYAAPFGILPGYGAELIVEVRAPGSRGVHLYAESGSVLGAIELEVDPAQFVPLDAEGHGRAVVRASAVDERATGRADVRLVAVDPHEPDEIAAELGGIGIAQEGTGSLVVSVLVALLLLGFTVQIVLGGLPVLALMIIVALTFMALNAPKLERARFEPRRLLPLRQRLVSSGLALSGVAIWVVAMMANLLSGIDCSDDCGPGDVIVDNLTVIVASFGLAACTALALVPAVRPRQLAGRLLILAAVTPLLFYDFTLIGYRVADKGTEAWVAGYPAFGWGLSAFALLAACFLYGFGRWWARVLLGVAAIAGSLAPFLVAEPGNGLPGNDSPVNGLHELSALVFFVATSLLLRLAIAPIRRWRAARVGLFTLAIAGVGLLSAGLLERGPATAVPLYGMIPLVCAVLWTLAEVSLWRWSRKRARRRVRESRVAPPTPESEPATTP